MYQSYEVLAAPCCYEHEQKRSTFTAVLHPVASREQALAALAAIRAQNPGASHYCWAYILGDAHQPEAMAFNDDGEPSGTAGKPMLKVLEHRGAGNCMAVVVRIFGGTKLGAGGLVRAYSTAVSKALDMAQWRELTACQELFIDIDFALEERVRHCLSQWQIPVCSTDYHRAVTLTASVPVAELSALQQYLRELASGAVHLRLGATHKA